jgi:hypothetical protein
VANPPLDDGPLEALRNLYKKQQGGEVGFVNIADARGLTELGLALRTAQGWEITEAGVSLLKGLSWDAPRRVSAQALKQTNAGFGYFPTLRGAQRQSELCQPAGVGDIDEPDLPALLLFVEISQGLKGAVVEGWIGHS